MDVGDVDAARRVQPLELAVAMGLVGRVAGMSGMGVLGEGGAGEGDEPPDSMRRRSIPDMAFSLKLPQGSAAFGRGNGRTGLGRLRCGLQSTPCQPHSAP